MSEYQYCEFQAIDRPLNERELRALRALSSRARITSTSFANTYEWGDFKGNPNELMEKCFDAFVYVANWGIHEFMLRLPLRLLDAKTATLYRAEDSAAVRVKGEHLILSFSSRNEDLEEWEDGQGWLSSLIPLRVELMRGDRRGLYLGWLLGAQAGELKDSAIEPPVPPGLAVLSGSLKGFAEFFWLDQSLIEVAAEHSAPLGNDALAKKDVAAWIQALPEAERDSLLLRFVQGDDQHLNLALSQRFEQERKREEPPTQDSRHAGRRTVKELLAAAHQRGQEKKRLAAELEAHRRAQRLDQLAKREDSLWRQVHELVAIKKPKGYAEAVRLLSDLRDVGSHKGRSEQFEKRLRQLCEQNSKRFGLKWRLQEANLIKAK